MSVRFKSPTHCIVHELLSEALGPPATVLGRDDHWSVSPYPKGPPINVLLNGSRDVPVVWVFDPHDYDDGVIYEFVQNEADVQRIVESILLRVKRAQEAASQSGSSIQIR